MWRRGGSLTGLLVLAWASSACAGQPGKCTLLYETTTAHVDVETVPVRVCTVQFIATAANGWVQVYDPAPTAVTIAEPGSATALNSAQPVNFGPEGFVTEYGLSVNVRNGRVIIRYGR